VARILESLFIDGPAGQLEALLEAPDQDAPRELALVCHPHPLHGGTLHNKVVYRLARALRRNGAAVLRFNFRGVGGSQGQHAGGPGEIEDARACVAWLRARFPGLPYTLAGFSFGSRVAAALACTLPDAARVIAAGFPTRIDSFPCPLACSVPKIVVQSTHDPYGPKEELERRFAEFSEPKTLLWIEARDHFFAGALDAFEDAVFRLGAVEARPEP
jgi:hypothetical protein